MIDPILESIVKSGGFSSEMREAKDVSAFLAAFIQTLFNNLDESSRSYDRSQIGSVAAKKLSFLKYLVNTLYLPGTPEIPISTASARYPASYRKEYEELFHNVIVPYFIRSFESEQTPGHIREELNRIKGPLPAIQQDELALLSGHNHKLESFLVNALGYTPIQFEVYRSFSDKDLETLYSNDGISLSKPEINGFVSFFVSGNGDNDKPYDPEKYYGGIPVLEDTIIAYLRDEGYTKEIISKLTAIMKISKRFYCEIIGGKECYCLKTQYLNNTQAYSVAILYREGRPLHLEDIHAKIVELEKQFPGLVKAPSLSSMQLRRKPVIASAGAVGERRLLIWSESQRKTDPYSAIRDYVEKRFAQTCEPVSFDSVDKMMRSLGFEYPKKSLKTYCTTVCTSVRGKGYIPKGAGEGDKRHWYGAMPRLQRALAKILLNNGKKGLTYSELQKKVREEEAPVSRNTLIRAIESLPDVFSTTMEEGAYRVRLTGSITSESAIRSRIPDKIKKETALLARIKSKMANYLFSCPEYRAMQIDLVTLFKDELPETMRSRDALIRGLLNDKAVFTKEKVGKRTDRVVSLNPLYVKKKKLESQTTIYETNSQTLVQADIYRYDYGSLKSEILKRHSKFFENVMSSEELNASVDGMISIMKLGQAEFSPNSSFEKHTILHRLHRYYCLKTGKMEREELRDALLLLVERYLKNYVSLIYGEEYNNDFGLGSIVADLEARGDLPKKASGPYKIPDYDFNLNKQTHLIVRQRNKQIGHVDNTVDRSDASAVEGINACMNLFLHISWRRECLEK